MRALVVDDARVARKMVARMVESLGFEVFTAEDGEDALRQLEAEGAPDAIITDWNMPVMDGVEFAKAVRQSVACSNIPILMISSEADPRRVAKALLSGVDEYLFKPVDAGMIRERLEVMGIYTYEEGGSGWAVNTIGCLWLGGLNWGRCLGSRPATWPA